MRRILAALALLLGTVGLAATPALWSRVGRTVLVESGGAGSVLVVRYTRSASDGDGLALLRRCVTQRGAQYQQVSCLMYDSAALLRVTNPGGERPCWRAAAIRRPSGPIEVQQDNPALTLSAACGGRLRLP